MNQWRLLLKAAIVGFLTLILLIPLAMIHGAVSERKELRASVIQDIASSAAEQQTFFGPLLIVPYREQVEEQKWDPTKSQWFKEVRTVDKTLRIAPRKLDVSGDVKTEERYRGIHKALIYSTELAVDGFFETEDGLGLADKNDKIEWKPAYVVIGVHDVRGIKKHPELMLDGVSHAFGPGVTDIVVPSGIRSPLGILSRDKKTYAFSFTLALEGTSSLEFVPVGRDTSVALTSKWPHPSFFGRHLPDTRTITEKGFEAKWQTSHFSTNVEQVLGTCDREGLLGCDRLRRENAFGVTFVEPVDIYLQAERAVKYGFLFIALTFAAFFFFEIIKKLAIHPIQYALVGVALAVFFLLLLSLSEHIAFGIAYLVSASACVSIVSIYTGYVLRSFARGAAFSALLTALYGVLFVLLRLETYSLLMGSIVLFAIVSGIMLITRKVDWYQVGNSSPTPSA